MRTHFMRALPAAMLAACATTAEIPDADNSPAGLAALLEGGWQTLSSDTENNFYDQRFTLPPLGDGVWMYTELRTGPERSLYRQRVVQMVTGSSGEVLQNTYSLRDAAGHGDLSGDAAAREALQFADLKPTLTPGCEIIWTYSAEDEPHSWRGIVDPASCRIYSERRQQDISIGAETRAGPNSLWQTEKGYTLAGEQLFGGPEGSFIKLERSATQP